MLQTNFLRKNWNWLALILILTLGFYLRAYHLDYPVIGYHNMKEAHTLGEAWVMYNEGDYFTNKLVYNLNPTNPQGKHIDNIPILSWIIVPLWKIFGVKLWLARAVVILFSLGSIGCTYLLAKSLFRREDISLLSAFLAAACPLLIFFGRNVQYDTLALFFMLVSAYLFIRWKESNSNNHLFLCLLFLALTGFTKIVFLIIVIPLLAIFPFRRFFRNSFYKKHRRLLLMITSFVLVVFVFFHLSGNLAKGYNALQAKPFLLEEISLLLTPGFWKTIFHFAAIENFTPWVMYLAFLGLLLSVIKIKSWNYRFLSVWFFSYLVYAASTPSRMTGHNYYQIPFAPLILILAAYSLLFAAVRLFTFIKRKRFRKMAVCFSVVLFIILCYPSLKAATAAKFDTQFLGLDIAGEYLLANSHPSETIFESEHQDKGLTWHAKRKLVATNNLGSFMQYEDRLNASWVFVYQWGFQWLLGNQELKEYIYDTYSLKQMAFIQTPSGNKPLYFLFQKGGYFDDKLNELIKGKQVMYKEYEFTSKKITVYFVNI